MQSNNKYRLNSLMARVLQHGFVHGPTGQVVTPDSTGQCKQLMHNILKTNRNQQSHKQRVGTSDKQGATDFHAPKHWSK